MSSVTSSGWTIEHTPIFIDTVRQHIWDARQRAKQPGLSDEEANALIEEADEAEMFADAVGDLIDGKIDPTSLPEETTSI